MNENNTEQRVSLVIKGKILPWMNTSATTCISPPLLLTTRAPDPLNNHGNHLDPPCPLYMQIADEEEKEEMTTLPVTQIYGREKYLPQKDDPSLYITQRPTALLGMEKRIFLLRPTAFDQRRSPTL